jgi:hypothetical protein
MRVILITIGPFTSPNIGVVNPASAHRDKDLAGPRARNRYVVANNELLQPAVSRQQGGRHLIGDVWIRRVGE